MSSHTEEEIAAAVAAAVSMDFSPPGDAFSVAGAGSGGAAHAGGDGAGPVGALFTSPFELIDSREGVARVVDALQNAWDSHRATSPGKPFVLGLDLEGMNDGDPSTRNQCTILTISLPRGFDPRSGRRLPPYVILVDLLGLGEVGWDLPGAAHPGVTLRALVTHPDIIKALWDIRFDLFTLSQGHGVLLPKCSVVDLQVLCLWKTRSRKEFLFGLGPQTLRDLLPGHPDFRKFMRGGVIDQVDEAAKRLWKDRAPYSGSLGVWRVRPVPEEYRILLAYSSNDGTYLLDLYDSMEGGVTHPLVIQETAQRWEASVVPTWKNTREHARNPAVHWAW